MSRLLSTLTAVSAGGMLGALARYAVGAALPSGAGAFPWGTFTVNVSGCLAIGFLVELWPHRRLVRLFLGTGLLGGYTTFSAYAVETQHLVQAGAVPTALAYLGGTVVTAVLAVYAGSVLARLVRAPAR